MNKNDMVIFSVDDHIVETGDIFDQHIPLKYKDLAPKCVENDDGFTWQYQGKPSVNFALNAVAGRPRDELGFEPNRFDQIRKGCYEAKARLDDMSVNGVFAGVNFPTFPGFALEMFQTGADRDLNTAVIQAYNDWHIDEFCAVDKNRLIPMVSLPLYDIAAAVAELKRCVAKGARTISMPSLPHQLGLPTIHDDYWRPLWKALSDEQIPVSLHISALNTTGSQHLTMDSPMGAFLTKVGLASMAVLSEWLWSEFIHDYRDLKVILSEGGIGWIPYTLERAELVYKNHGPWMRHDWKGRRPTDVYRDQFISCFIQDEVGIEMRHKIGIDTITFENDYPHADITWPNTPEQLWTGEFKSGEVPQEDIDKITYKNAARIYRWDAVERLGRENCNVAALRAKAGHVDLTPISKGGKPPAEHSGTVRARDIMRLFPQSNSFEPAR
ncbi:MAG: amidohydrolase family protein [Caulobacterales bacterium]